MENNGKKFLWIFGVLFLVLSASEGCPPVWAQAVSVAQIAGVVTDSSGAAIPSAQIKATQTSTGLVRTTISGPDGSYLLASLPVGAYELRVSAPGFRRYIQSGIELHVANKVQINVTLQIGSLSQQVEVMANTNMVETHSTSVSQVIGQRRIIDLPLNGRQATQLVLLAGASQNVTSGLSGRFDLSPSGGIGKQYPTEVPISVAGGQANGTNWLLDGADNNDAFVNVSMPYPFPDALQEFSVETSTLSSRYGLHPGAVVNVVTKSGSNQMHGDLFDFLRNGDVNARNFFAATQDTLRRNQFGGTLGGPILKDKLFFFGGYQGTRNRSNPPQSIAFVPTEAALNGDFTAIESAACQSSGKPRMIIDPTTGGPFPNDFVSPSRFNPQALALLKFVPISSNPCGKIVYGVPATGDEDQVIGRIDWTQSEKHSLFGRYFLADWSNPAVFNGTNILPTQRQGVLDRSQSFVLGDTYSLSPTAVNSLHFAATRMRIIRGAPSNYISPKTLGINITTAAPNFLGLSVSGHFGTGGPGPTLRLINNSFQVSDDVDIIHGSHHLSLGFEYFRNQMNERNLFNQNGSFSFDGSFTGDPLVDFMLGDLGSFTQSAPEAQNWRANVWGFYGGDEIHVNSHLELTAGLRWEPYLPAVDRFGRGSHFEPAAFAAGRKSNQYSSPPPGLLFNSDPGIPHAYTNTHLLDLDPRVGVIWDLTGKGLQTIRASYGIFYDSPMIFYFDRFGSTPPWGANITVPHPPGGLSNPWAEIPGGDPFPLPFPPTFTQPFPLEASYINLPLDLHPTYMQQWNLSYQRQFGTNWLVSATYLGNKTTHIWIGDEIDPAVFIPGECNAQPCSTIKNTNQRRVLYLENPAAGAFYSTIAQTDDGANAEYNGLLLKFQHRFSHNFTILSNYTYSHCISEGDFQGELIGPDYQNPNNRNADRGNCLFDHRHIFNTSIVATSPRLSQEWAERLLGNWQLAPIISVSSGSWFTVYTGVDNSLTGVGWDRPNSSLANPYPNKQSVTQWINPAAFAANTLGTFGNSGRNSLLGPNDVEFDTALSRFFPLGEQRRLEVRFEAFNVINRPNFGTPVNNMVRSQFGQVLTAADPRILQFALRFFF